MGVSFYGPSTGGSSSGEGGTDNYNSLINKPSLNGYTISGNKTNSDYGLLDITSFLEGENITITEKDGQLTISATFESSGECVDYSEKITEIEKALAEMTKGSVNLIGGDGIVITETEEGTVISATATSTAETVGPLGWSVEKYVGANTSLTFDFTTADQEQSEIRTPFEVLYFECDGSGSNAYEKAILGIDYSYQYENDLVTFTIFENNADREYLIMKTIYVDSSVSQEPNIPTSYSENYVTMGFNELTVEFSPVRDAEDSTRGPLEILYSTMGDYSTEHVAIAGIDYTYSYANGIDGSITIVFPVCSEARTYKVSQVIYGTSGYFESANQITRAEFEELKSIVAALESGSTASGWENM